MWPLTLLTTFPGGWRQLLHRTQVSDWSTRNSKGSIWCPWPLSTYTHTDPTQIQTHKQQQKQNFYKFQKKKCNPNWHFIKKSQIYANCKLTWSRNGVPGQTGATDRNTGGGGGGVLPGQWHGLEGKGTCSQSLDTWVPSPNHMKVKGENWLLQAVIWSPHTNI